MYLPFHSCEQVIDALSATHAEALWLLCVSDTHAADLSALLDASRKRGIRVCGGFFPGLIDGSRRVSEGIIAIPLPADCQCATARLTADSIHWLQPLPERLPGATASAMLLVDCQAPGISVLLEEVFDLFGNGIHYAGAGAGFHDLRREASIFDDAGLIPDGALFILVPRRATVQVQHGWTRASGPFIATRTKGNVIQELNWEPAGTYYRNQIGLLDPDLRDKPVFPDLSAGFPLSIGKENGEDVVRDPVYISDADEVVVLSDVAENSAIYLSCGNAQSLVQAARRAVENCGEPDDVAACFVSDCFSRALMLGDAFPDELKAVAGALKRFTDVPAEGVLGLGEIGANGRSNLEFYNKTFVVALSHH